jgi:hypothetical protein
MASRTKDIIRLLGSLIGIVIGTSWVLGRIVPVDLLSPVPLPLAIIVLLGGLGGASFRRVGRHERSRTELEI